MIDVGWVGWLDREEMETDGREGVGEKRLSEEEREMAREFYRDWNEELFSFLGTRFDW